MKSNYKRFAIDGKPLDIIKLLYTLAKEVGTQVEISKKHWKFEFQSEYAKESV